MKMTPKDKLAAGRFSAGKIWPYFRTMVGKLQPYPVPGYSTMGVTRDWILTYDPEAILDWTIFEVAATLVHEAMHCLRNHHRRGDRLRERHGGVDTQLICIAADCEINDDIHGLPDWAITPKKIKAPEGLTMEEYFQHLLKKAKSVPKNPQLDLIPDDAQLVKKARSEGYGRSKRETAQIQRQTAEGIRTHVEQNGAASIPNSLLRWTDDLLGPSKIPWQQILRRTIRHSARRVRGASERTYRKMSKRQGGLGYGLGSPKLGGLYTPKLEVAVIVDTSGSMGKNELKNAISETAGILKAVGGSVKFCACDADTDGSFEVRKPLDLAKRLKGGGGTDMRPAFEAVAKDKSNMIVCITDGCFYEVPEQPKAHVVWVVVGKYTNTPWDYGETVKVES